MNETNHQHDDLSGDPELAAVLLHMDSLKDKGKVEASTLNFLMQKMAEKQAIINKFENQAKKENQVLMRMKAITKSVLKDLDWTEFKCPFGQIKVRPITQVTAPKSPEDKLKLFDWMREKQIYDRYATVHATALKSLFEAEFEEASKHPEFDPMTFCLPGMVPATFYEDLKFTPVKEREAQSE